MRWRSKGEFWLDCHSGRLWLAVKNRMHRVDAIVVHKRRNARQHFAQHNAKRKHVAATIHALAQQLFRRHVVDGSHQRAGLGFDAANECFLFTVGNEGAFAFGDEFCQTEVENLCVAIATEHQVLGF